MPRNKGGLQGLRIPLLSDLTKSIASNYGVLDEDLGLALRATFIIDPKGIVRQVSTSDLGVGRNINEILRLVEAFQYNDKNGEVCPANWKKGQKTMKG
jgi:alkyl hydroperoxide reductase subunit AhpC